MWQPEGVIVPMFTPCLADGRLDPRGIAEYVRYLRDRAGVAAIFPRCGLGQMYTFTCDEAVVMMQHAIPAAGTVPVLPGTAGEFSGDRNARPDPDVYLKQTVALSVRAQQLGAAAAVVVLPWALPVARGVSVEDVIVAYYQAVDRSIDIPIMIYQPPGTDEAFRMTPSLMRRLARLDHMAGMKLSSDDADLWRQLGDTAAATGFTMICGAEHGYLTALAHGARGVIGEGCNLYPEILYAVRHYYLAGDLAKAEKAQAEVNRLLTLKADCHATILGKALARRRGYDVPVARRIATGIDRSGYAPERSDSTALPDADFMARYDAEITGACQPYLDLAAQHP